MVHRLVIKLITYTSYVSFSLVWSIKVYGLQNELGVWVGDVISASDISGLRKSKNIEFDTKVASGTRMMHALRFWEKFF